MNNNLNKWPNLTAREKREEPSNQQLVEHSFGRKGNLEFKIGGTEVQFKYSTPDIKSLLNSLLWKIRTIEPNVGKLKILTSLRKLDNFTLKNSLHKFSVKDILPEGWEIFFITTKDQQFNSSISIEEKIIFLNENLLTARGILSFGHEIGHYEEEMNISEWESKTRTVARAQKNFGVLDKKTDELIVKEERNAWARALNHLRHFSKDFNILNDEIAKTVHRDCLQSYEQNTKVYENL